MKTLTLIDYIENKQATDVDFSEHYIREQTINNIAEMIVAARRKAHLTQAGLANKVGTKLSVISRIESGNSHFIPSIETLVRIAGALHMKLKLQLQP